TTEQLHQKAADFKAFIDDKQNNLDLMNMAYTLQTGREEMSERLGLIVSSTAELADKLQAFLNGETTVDGMCQGQIKDKQDTLFTLSKDESFLQTVAQWIEQKQLTKLSTLWVKGLVVDWHKLFSVLCPGQMAPQRVSLPNYPFAKERLWFDDADLGQPLQPVVTTVTTVVQAPVEKLVMPTIKPVVLAAPAVIETPVAATSVNGLEEELRISLADALYLKVTDVKVDQPFIDLGLDSIVGVEWVRDINQTYGTNITATKVYDYSTVKLLAEFLSKQVGDRVSVETVTVVVEPVLEKSVGKFVEEAEPTLSLTELEQQLTASLADALYLKLSDVNINKPFIDLGLDSIVGVEWVRDINQSYDINITATKVYDHPDLKSFAAFLKAEYFKEVKRNVPVSVSVPVPVPQPLPAAGHYGLTLNQPLASLDQLALTPWSPAPLAADEIAINVKASAINFPDTMCVRGLYPTMPDYPFVPGFEVAGVVTQVGNQVSRFKVGDAVISLTGKAMGGHASRVNVPACNAVLKPHNISFEQGCCLPVAFVTAHYAFELAKLGRDESVLIHTATGGVGLMALQLAALRGAVPYTTTSKQAKVDILAGLGINQVLDHRTDFDQQLKQMTDGKGIDVVLNMLSGDGIQKGLNCLAPSGRYLEIAVHALKTSQKLDLSSMVENQSIHSIDIRRLASQAGEFSMQDLLAPMTAMLQNQQIVPIVSRIYPASQITDALHYVSQGQHIGKVVISHSAQQMTDLTEDCLNRVRDQRQRAAKAVLMTLPVTTVNSMPSKIAQPIAVIGMAGQFPMANDVDQFWQNISEGKNCISEVPAHRWDNETYYQSGAPVEGKTNSKWMGLLEQYDQFDPLFFNISPTEAQVMDPQQRVFLQSSWLSIENAGYNPHDLSGSKTGVFVGCGMGDYHRLAPAKLLSAQGLLGSYISILAARIAYFLNLQGPCVSIDTACSSSLVAIANACDSLTSGASDTALAGGVCVMASPAMHIMTAQAGMLSENGRCHAFDQRANGFVAGEGVGVLMLKRLSDAQRDNDRILGVIEGWGVNQDGKTNGITAPSTASQTRLQRDVFERFNIDPNSIQLIEAHGTGTKLGDPIEVDALKDAYQSDCRTEKQCALGSVKSNIGHCLTAAGVSGVIKLLMAIKHQQLPPTINFEQQNEHIELDGSPFYINDKLQPWLVGDNEQRRAAVSSFGFSGTNANMVIAEYAAPVATARHDDTQEVVIMLSAKTQAQLQQKGRDLLAFINKSGNNISLTDMAYTLQVGREVMDERWAVEVDSLEQLTEKLQALVEGREVDGKPVAQADNYSEVQGNRIELPGYPFAQERYWIDDEDLQPITGGVVASVLHPLLHTNISNMSQQRYNSVFTGDEFFLADHQVKGQKILPAVAYLEMARAAVEQAVLMPSATSVVTLHNAIWAQPIVVEQRKSVDITLVVNDVDDKFIDFEVVSDEVLHCQGQLSYQPRPKAIRLDINGLQAQMNWGQHDAKAVYDAFSRFGLSYGLGHRGIKTIKLGEQQLLAQLRLPESVLADAGQYILHPSLLDCALQACIGLSDLNNLPDEPTIPFALENLTVLSACTTDMFAWVRSGEHNKMDIDLCDSQGNVCVQITGFSTRAISATAQQKAQPQHKTQHTEQHNNKNANQAPSSFDETFYQDLIERILDNDISVDDAVDLG
ncbi:MAG: polyketide synthase dehydratase domain-containing protein, partial [Algicola sp.]|nr:polyketide synthase dehydratase domain-containing protein [Algicola sp.]